MHLNDLLRIAAASGASDLHLKVGSYPMMRINGSLVVASVEKRLDRNDTVTQVRQRIRESLPSGVPSQADVARVLALSPRTLARRLEEAGTSFTAIVDETRRALAEQYLQRTDFSVAEVAYLVGFAESSSFNRAFRRWTGHAPGDARAKA
jgi:AraC-like DNA-binding protein